jgi:hypothetical protein
VKALAGLVAGLGLIAGCATAVIPHATALDAQRTGVALQALEHGRGLFVARCGNCHLTPDPGSRSAADWAKVLPEMLEDSHLNAQEAAEVLAFLQALSADSGSGHVARANP